MRSDERDRDRSAGQKHRKILHAAAFREEFRLSGKLEADFVHARLVNRAGDDGIEFAFARKIDSFFQGSSGGARGFGCRFA